LGPGAYRGSSQSAGTKTFAAPKKGKNYKKRSWGLESEEQARLLRGGWGKGESGKQKNIQKRTMAATSEGNKTTKKYS